MEVRNQVTSIGPRCVFEDFRFEVVGGTVRCSSFTQTWHSGFSSLNSVSFMRIPSPGFYGKRSFSVTTPCASPTRVNTERLAERETLLHRLGSKLNRIVFNSCGNSLSVAQITRDFYATRFFCEQSHFHEIDYFWKHQTSNSRLRHSI